MESRLYRMNVSVETSALPDPGTPTFSYDLVTKTYVDTLAAAAPGYYVENSHASPYAVVAGTSIPFTVGKRRVKKYVQGSGGAVTVTASPRIQAGTIDGQELLLVGCSDANTVSLDTGNGTQKNGVDVMIDGSITKYIWDHGQALWVEQSRNNI